MPGQLRYKDMSMHIYPHISSSTGRTQVSHDKTIVSSGQRSVTSLQTVEADSALFFYFDGCLYKEMYVLGKKWSL